MTATSCINERSPFRALTHEVGLEMTRTQVGRNERIPFRALTLIVSTLMVASNSKVEMKEARLGR